MVEMYIGDKESIAYPAAAARTHRMVGRGFHKLRKGLEKSARNSPCAFSLWDS